MKISTTPIKSILILSTILISSCDYYSPEVKKISEKYDIGLDEAKRCELKFGENTEKVLNWIEVNKSWFFGLFSENCDDLIAQLPPFGRYDNLLAAKDNNWQIDDPAYKAYVIKRNKEIAEEKEKERQQELQDHLKKMTSGTLVKYEEFGERWPFTFKQGYLDCVGSSAVFRAGMTEYGLNGFAVSRGYSPIDSIWRNNPEIPGTKINISEMIQLACSN
ncbi:DUF2511 domain-containing protein [Stutzerimonas nitrititolerans]|uniref:DUF2511 domain-containing protein n=1 Tax=Stutzerimonas nitrititolerans TaxID=2482751 RepID=UPI0028A68120|nr:DUF2511 domain-containing protein [Stutzerimonas nitrititolerans]